MVLKLDPRFPLVWRSPTSLQFGVSTPLVVLDDVTSAHERLVAALAVGVSRPGLAMIAQAAGTDESAITALLDVLAPAMTPTSRPAVGAVTIVGSGPATNRIAESLGGVGVRVTVVPDHSRLDDAPGDLGIAVGDFVLAPDLHGAWLRRDIPHLSVVFSDSTVTIGPLVEPGVGPCLYCLQRYRSDADPAWPAIAAQLWGRRAAAETPLVASEVAAIVSRITIARLEAGHASSTHRSLELDVATGDVTTTEWLPHPLCECTGSGLGVSAAARPGTGSPGAVPHGTARPRSTRSQPTRDSTCAERV